LLERKAVKRILDSTAILRAGRRPYVVAVISTVLLGFFLYHLTRFSLSKIWPLMPMGDALIIFDLSRQVFSQSDYVARLQLGNMDSVFPYSPSAVVLFKLLTIFGPTVFMTTWVGLMGAGLLVSLRAPFAHERTELASNWMLIGVLAVLLAGSSVSWDLRNVNSNLIYLGLVLAGFSLLGRKPLLAGTLIALSISWKLYSGLLLLWLAMHGPRQALYSAAATIVVLWVAVPVACFGVDSALQMYAGWSEQIRIVGDAWVYLKYDGTGIGPPLVTLRGAIMALTGAMAESVTVQTYLLMLWTVWGAALCWYAWRALRAVPLHPPSRAALADWVVLLMAPLPFSPWLEPYHAIPVLPGAVLCLIIALDDRVDRSDRVIALAAMAGLSALILGGTPFRIRGLGLLAQFMVLTIALGALRIMPSAQSGLAAPSVPR
jgi:hypothetical protein